MRLGRLGSSSSSVTTNQFRLFSAAKTLAFALVIMAPQKQSRKCRRLQKTRSRTVPPSSLVESSLNSSKKSATPKFINVSSAAGSRNPTENQFTQQWQQKRRGLTAPSVHKASTQGK
ncbi:hypothetical protein SESBI_47421 [Sesbania bispinosa]|nr:hypothetical protein SESBI_47421 [Sesbania bispinosa]